jgi:integrase
VTAFIQLARTYTAVRAEDRRQALTEMQYRSPPGSRPYDLRHTAMSLWLNSGVPATVVARRARHGVAVLLKIYAYCIDGQADAANRRMKRHVSGYERVLARHAIEAKLREFSLVNDRELTGTSP